VNTANSLRETDVLVIGTGLAGCAVAAAAARESLKVVMISGEREFTESASFYAQGGIIYPKAGDSWELLRDDFQRTGAGLVNESAVRQVFQHGGLLIDEILVRNLQVPFNRTETGELALTKEGSHTIPRIAYVMDYTGEAIQKRFSQKLKTLPNVEILTAATAIDLITLAHHSLNPLHIYKPSTCAGAYVFFQDEDQVYPILAKETVLTTGGLGRLFLHSSNPQHARGDGYAMAYRAGARLMNMEYVQFHPTTLFSTDEERFLISEALRGEGGILRNKDGEDFMLGYHELGSLAPRDIVSRSIMQEMNRTGTNYVYLDITHRNSDWIRERFPKIYQKCLEVKVDITKEPVPVVPAAHYECGGVATDLLGNTTIGRLKAIGEVACTGLHGANRLASSSLLECLVFGTLAGQDCAKRIQQSDYIIPSVAQWKLKKEPVDYDLIRQDRLTIKQTMWNYVGIVRTRKKLERAFSILWRLQQDIETFYAQSELSDELIGLRNAATTSLLVLHAARLHKGSRGCHYRED
jgi:L-aspartate oxidase